MAIDNLLLHGRIKCAIDDAVKEYYDCDLWYFRDTANYMRITNYGGPFMGFTSWKLFAMNFFIAGASITQIVRLLMRKWCKLFSFIENTSENLEWLIVPLYSEFNEGETLSALRLLTYNVTLNTVIV